jgi:exopolysaccharide production protein ExoZ
MVVFFHAANTFGPTAYFPEQSWEVAFLFGHSGVELFFVLSGFIMCHVHWTKLSQPGEMMSYIRKRLVRIYPPVLLVVTIWASLRFATGKPLSAEEWFVSTTLIPVGFAYAPPVLWTLTFEMAFYILFLSAFWNRQAFLLIVIGWGMSGYMICQFTEIGHANAINPVFGSGYSFLFSVGVLTYFIRQRYHPGLLARSIMQSVAVVIFAIAAWQDVVLQLSGLIGVELEVASRFLTPLFGVAGSLAIIAMPNDASSNGPSRLGRFFGLMGDASFSIYLWHLLGQRIVTAGIARLGLETGSNRGVAVVVLVMAGILTGLLIYWYVERPMMARLMPWTRRRATG